jgi:hypothetical protein
MSGTSSDRPTAKKSFGRCQRIVLSFSEKKPSVKTQHPAACAQTRLKPEKTKGQILQSGLSFRCSGKLPEERDTFHALIF